MKKYIVEWKKEKATFYNVREAVKFAEVTGETGVNVYVYAEIDGVRDREPFFRCGWEI